MTIDPNHPQPPKKEVMAAVVAVLKARAALSPRSNTPLRRKTVSLQLSENSASTLEQRSAAETHLPSPVNAPTQLPPTAEELEAAQEVALEAFPEDVRAAARLALANHRQTEQGAILTQAQQGAFRPPSSPANLPTRPPAEDPPFPAAALDHPDVRDEWANAHRRAAEARFRLQPAVLRAHAEAQLAREKWDSKQRGRKPSGDLRHPVPRDRLHWITREMEQGHQNDLARAEKIISAIETGDVVGVEYFGDDSSGGLDSVPILVLQSDLDREAERQRALANRTPEEITADEAKWDEMLEELLAELPEGEPELVFPDLPELPTDREPTASEVAALARAMGKHLRYLDRGDQIEAKRRKDAVTKIRTAAERADERANPERTAAAKKAVHLNKAAERQRRWRERKKADKGTEK